MELPDLHYLVGFSSWLDEQLRNNISHQDIVDHITELKTPLANFRAALVLIRMVNMNEQAVAHLLRQVYLEGEQIHRNLSMVTHLHLQLVPLSPSAVNEVAVMTRTATHNLDSIMASLRSAPPHVLNFELEWRLLHAYWLVAKLQHDVEQMDVLSSKIVGLAEISGHEPLIRQARTQQANVMMQIGRYSESTQILLTETDKLQVKQGLYTDHFLIYDITVGLMNLGAMERGLQFIGSALEKLPGDERLQGRKYWLSMISGLEHNPQPPTYPAWGNDHTQSQVLYHATLADLRFPTNTMLKEQHEHLHNILTVFTVIPGSTYETDILFVRWLRGRTRLALHEYGLAVQELSRLPLLKSEELLNRLLINALILEIGMTPASLPSSTLEEAESNLRDVFELARQLPYAEPQSLARMMLRWHPHAAAYCALMPTPITELESVIENVMKTDRRTTWRAQSIPLGIASFLTRRALHISSQPPRVGGNLNAQLKRLHDEHHALNVFGPLIAPLPTALGLLRRGHTQATATVLQQFGTPAQVADDTALRALTDLMQRVAQGDAPITAVNDSMQQLR